MKRGIQKFIGFGLAVILIGGLTACGSNSMPKQSMLMEQKSDSAYPQEEYAESYALDGMGAGSIYGNATGEEASVTQPSASERKLIKTVDMSVETKEFDELLETLNSQIASAGGYVENFNSYNGSMHSSYRGTRNADMSIRIPKDQLDSFLDTISGITNVVSRSENVEDITLSYVDLKSHKEALEVEQARLLELLEKAESIEDIIVIEERLSNVRYQIGSMESQLRTYDNKVDYSTVYLNINEVQELTPVSEETAWERISFGFVNNIKNIAKGFVEMGIWILINIPYIFIWVVVITIIILLARLSVKKNKANKKVDPNVTVQNSQQIQNTVNNQEQINSK